MKRFSVSSRDNISLINPEDALLDARPITRSNKFAPSASINAEVFPLAKDDINISNARYAAPYSNMPVYASSISGIYSAPYIATIIGKITDNKSPIPITESAAKYLASTILCMDIAELSSSLYVPFFCPLW